MPIKILMPALSPTMTEGNLVKWHKKEGDTIVSGDILAEIETDKATMEIEAVDEGKLAKILIPEGTEEVKVNEVIAVMLEEDEDASKLDSFLANLDTSAAPAAKPAAETKTATETAPAPQPTTAPIAESANTGSRILATPLAKRVAQQGNVDLKTVAGSGPHGRIIKADVESAGKKGTGPRPMPARSEDGLTPTFDVIKVSNIRKIVAQRLTEAKQQVPHFYLTVECEVDELMRLREQINNTMDDWKISVNDMIIRACALALIKVPAANASWGGDHIKHFHSADISVAVAIDEGLVTPIIRSAETKTLLEISTEAKALIIRARDGKLRPEEFQGGTFSLSNLGMYGISHFGAIINPPQGCIIAVGAAEDKVVFRDGQFKVVKSMSCTLSVDHRVVDGAVGATFLQAFKDIITNPYLLVL